MIGFILYRVGGNCAGMPLPRSLLPEGTSFEEERDGVFHFDVTFKAPIVGFIVGYRGWLKPAG